MQLHDEIIAIQHDLKIPNHVLCLILGIQRTDYRKFKRGEIRIAPYRLSMFQEITQRPLYCLYPRHINQKSGERNERAPSYMVCD